MKIIANFFRIRWIVFKVTASFRKPSFMSMLNRNKHPYIVDEHFLPGKIVVMYVKHVSVQKRIW